jgi:hypothetical protein
MTKKTVLNSERDPNGRIHSSLKDGREVIIQEQLCRARRI